MTVRTHESRPALPGTRRRPPNRNDPMTYSEMPLLFLLAAVIGCTASVVALLILAAVVFDKEDLKPVPWLAAAVVIMLPTGIWGVTSMLSFSATANTETIAHFEDYGFQLTGEDAARIRTHHEADHTMHLDTAEGVTEVLFRSVDGVVVPFSSDGSGIWTPIEPTA